MVQKAICAYVLKDESLLPNSKSDEDDTPAMAAALIIVLFLVVLIGILIKKNWNNDLCPKCRHHSLKRTDQLLRRTDDGKLLVIYKCSKCGHTVAKEENDDQGSGGGMSPLLPFLFLGGGRSGGFWKRRRHQRRNIRRWYFRWRRCRRKVLSIIQKQNNN